MQIGATSTRTESPARKMYSQATRHHRGFQEVQQSQHTLYETGESPMGGEERGGWQRIAARQTLSCPLTRSSPMTLLIERRQRQVENLQLSLHRYQVEWERIGNGISNEMICQSHGQESPGRASVDSHTKTYYFTLDESLVYCRMGHIHLYFIFKIIDVVRRLRGFGYT